MGAALAGAVGLALGSTHGARAADDLETAPLETVPTEQDIEDLESAQATADSNPVEPDAVDALHRMGGYLRSLKMFSVRADTALDEVTEDGMKLQFGGTLTASVRRPDGLVLEVNTDRKHRRLYYDGKTLTVYAPRDGYYAIVDAPPTIAETAEAVSDKYGVDMPLVDLFSWGADSNSEEEVREAAIIGPARIGGVLCDHVAVRQDDVDWQVWIQRGDRPLPRKIVITTKSEPEQPQYVATLTWDTDAKFTSNTFHFSPPKEAHKIDLVAPSDGGVTEAP